MAKTIVKPWVKVFGVIVAVAAIVFGLYNLDRMVMVRLPI